MTIFSEPRDLAPAAELLQVPCFTAAVGHSGFRRYTAIVRQVAGLVRKERVDAVLSMPFGWHLFVALGSVLGGAGRIVAHVGNHPEPARMAKWRAFRAQVQLARPFTRALACCSDYVRRGIIKEFGVSPRETATVPNGVKLDQWQVASRRSDVHRRGTARIVMVGTLEPHKDQDTLIKAMPILNARLARSGRAAELMLIGDGPRRGELTHLLQAQGQSPPAVLIGTRRDIPEILAQANVFAFSTTPREGQGIALVEAMAAGVPIVASDVGACREVLADGLCGILVPPNDPGALAEGIATLLENPDTARCYVAAAKHRARALYSIESAARRYAELLEVV